jgi:serine/threonine protein kinase
MDDTQNSVNESEWMIRTSALRNFLSCLIHAIHFLHDQNLKHMDIKPKNVLVQRSSITPRTVESYKVYIADFGIARAYQFPTEAETDSPTSYTRKYAAPEVVRQDKRGFSADIFSLGCVFMEIISTVFHAADEQPELETMRCHKNGDSSYHANIEAVRNWYHSVGQTRWQWAKQSDQRYMYINPGLIAALPRMIDELPELRPTAGELKEYTSTSCCSKGLDGPEPFEYAKSI